MIVTLHEPSNGAADAVVGAKMAVIAKAVASVTARREELIIGTLVLASKWHSGAGAFARSTAPGWSRCTFS
jgi:hypothetical protein